LIGNYVNITIFTTNYMCKHTIFFAKIKSTSDFKVRREKALILLTKNLLIC